MTMPRKSQVQVLEKPTLEEEVTPTISVALKEEASTTAVEETIVATEPSQPNTQQESKVAASEESSSMSHLLNTFYLKRGLV